MVTVLLRMHRARGKCSAILPGDQLFNLSQQQPITAAGAKIVRRGSKEEPAATPLPAPTSAANGAGDAVAVEEAVEQRPLPNGPPAVPVPQSLPMPSAGLGFMRVSSALTSTRDAHKKSLQPRGMIAFHLGHCAGRFLST